MLKKPQHIILSFISISAGMLISSIVHGDPQVTAPPQAIIEKFEKIDNRFDSEFYKKYLDVKGIAIFGSEKVKDAAFYETRLMITNILANRMDVINSMASRNTRFIIIASKEEVSNIPEYHIADPIAAKQLNKRARGLAGTTLASFSEENLLSYPEDRYKGESIMIHEFAHSIDGHLSWTDPDWEQEIERIYNDAMKSGLWNDTYAATNPSEYWAIGVQTYFDAIRKSQTDQPDGIHNHLHTREQLKEYDTALYDFIKKTLGSTKWRYTSYNSRREQAEVKQKNK